MVQEHVTNCLPYTESYFGACNTAEGFYSLFGEIFDPKKLDRIYILKGGPGTGKSTLMKKVALAAQQAGQYVRYYYCSSDTSSLDGIVLPDAKIAVLDGTAPHATDPCYPGAVEELINLGAYFDTAKLRRARGEIMAIVQEKQLLYRRVYDRLRCAASHMRICREICADALNKEKMLQAIQRILRGTAQTGESISNRCYVTAIGTKGIVHFSTFEQAAQKRLWVINGHGGNALFFQMMREEMQHTNTKHTVLCDIEHPALCEGIYLPKQKQVIRAQNNLEIPQSDRTINMERFYDKQVLREQRQALRAAISGAKSARMHALELLQQIGRMHEALEQIYIAQMDFSGVEQQTSELIKSIKKTF